MSAKPKPDAQADSDAAKRKPMPFEPRKSAEKTEKKGSKPPAKATASPKTQRQPAATKGIPDAVSRRMVQRVALFCGIPTALGMSTFVLSYLAVSRNWVALPTYAVLLVSLGWFGLGVLGVSYGVLSASWDEDAAGSPLGFAEFKTNWGRMREAWQSQNQNKQNQSK